MSLSKMYLILYFHLHLSITIILIEHYGGEVGTDWKTMSDYLGGGKSFSFPHSLPDELCDPPSCPSGTIPGGKSEEK
jgi:hypothetical protein